MLSRWYLTAIAIVTAMTTSDVARAACFAAFSCDFGSIEMITAPASGRSIKRVNHFITEPPPKSLRPVQTHQSKSTLRSYEQSHFADHEGPNQTP